MSEEPTECPYCGMEEIDWSWRQQKYGCYGCGKMFEGLPPRQIREALVKER